MNETLTAILMVLYLASGLAVGIVTTLYYCDEHTVKMTNMDNWECKATLVYKEGTK